MVHSSTTGRFIPPVQLVHLSSASTDFDTTQPFPRQHVSSTLPNRYRHNLLFILDLVFMLVMVYHFHNNTNVMV